MNTLIIAALAILCFYSCFKMKRENKLMRLLKLCNEDGKYPHLLDRDRTPAGVTYVYWIPDGVPFDSFTRPEGKAYQAIRQTLGDMHRIEVLPIDGHKLAVKVYEKELKREYAFRPEPVDAKNPLALALGEGYAGPVTLTLGDAAPHACIAGTTGSGKSVCLRSIIASIILHPKRVDLWLIDLKGGAEFYLFEKCERVVEYAKNVDEGRGLLLRLQAEMIRRYDLFAAAGVNNLDNYNRLGKRLRRQLLVVDEFAEFAGKKQEEARDILKDLLRRARAAGIHVIAATQRPDKDVLDGQIRANMPAYICFAVSSVTNSILVLGHGGAELLPGHGRGILRAPGRKEQEFQGYYLGEDECRDLIQHTYIDKPKQNRTKGAYYT
jgi:DNA segregation ATPase FtsK/SpoIIIE-like protein